MTWGNPGPYRSKRYSPSQSRPSSVYCPVLMAAMSYSGSSRTATHRSPLRLAKSAKRKSVFLL